MKDYFFFYAVILGLAVVANLFFIKSSIFGAFLAVGYFVLSARGWSRIFTTKTKGERYFYGFLLSTTLLSLVGGIVYRFYQLDNIAILAILLIVLIAPVFINEFYTSQNKFPRIHASTLGFLFIAIILAAVLTYILTNSATVESIRSPWETVPSHYFALLFLFWLTWIVGLLHLPSQKPWYVLPSFMALALYNIYTITLIVYPVGFGFDSFIHQATERLISDNSVAHPKPWYYLGQYSLVVLLHKLSLFPIFWIDRLLLPVATILSLGFVGTRALEAWLGNSKATILTIASLLLIPAAFLIVTTPQGLSNLIFIVIVLLTANNSSHYLILLLSLTATVVHPLAGIPALLLAMLNFIPRYLNKSSKMMSAILAILAIPIIPFLFWWQNSRHILTTNFFPLGETDSSQTLAYLSYHFDLIFDTIYLWHWNGLILMSILALIGMIIAYKKSLVHLFPLTLTTSYLLLNYLILSNAINFDFLISYERVTFADRFIDLSVITVLPFIALTLHEGFKKCLNGGEKYRFDFFALSFALLATITVYTVYPRTDAYQTNRGYSTSSADIEAVRKIHLDANGQDYVVLANQAVSAGALQELGFYKYFERKDIPTGEQIFFYPIPTGGSLYQIYLEMVYDAPTKAVAEKAMNLTGVDTVYFVLNDYWFNSENLNDIALTEAKDNFTIGDKIFVYKFKMK